MAAHFGPKAPGQRAEGSLFYGPITETNYQKGRRCSVLPHLLLALVVPLSRSAPFFSSCSCVQLGAARILVHSGTHTLGHNSELSIVRHYDGNYSSPKPTFASPERTCVTRISESKMLEGQISGRLREGSMELTSYRLHYRLLTTVVIGCYIIYCRVFLRAPLLAS